MSQKPLILLALAPAWVAMNGCTPVTDTGQTTTTTTTTTTARVAPTVAPSAPTRAFTPPPATLNLNAQATKAPTKTRPKAFAKTPTQAPAQAPTKAPTNAPPKTPDQTPKTKTQGVRVLDNGLKIEDLTVGTGATVKSGDTITVHYRGTLTDGTQFDSSYDRGQPATFTLGEVIEGWNIGLVGMREGGKRKLTIPGPLAYGPNSPTPKIPPNATLLFDVELVKVG